MKLSLFIANRIAFNEQNSFSRFIVRIAIIAITLSVSVMIVGTSITQGYQEVISNKFYNCWGHIHVTNFLPDASSLLNDEKIIYDENLVKNINSISEVKLVQPYSIQSCIAKSKTDMEGLLLKGISNNESFEKIHNYLSKGELINFSDTSDYQLLLSQHTCDNLGLKIGDKLILYFLNKNQFQPKARKTIVKGIFNTGLEDYDKLFAICDARLIHAINQDSANTIQGYEIYLNTPTKADQIQQEIYDNFLTPPLQTYTLQQRFASVFSWLGMMKMNERIIIIIMLIIAIINMITALLILILERTQMIGMLKSMGMKNAAIQKIFLINSTQIIAIGVTFGTIIGIGICLLQKYAGIIKLDEATYYVKTVPIAMHIQNILWIDTITIISCVVLLLIPSYIIKSITPVKALKFN